MRSLLLFVFNSMGDCQGDCREWTQPWSEDTSAFKEDALPRLAEWVAVLMWSCCRFCPGMLLRMTGAPVWAQPGLHPTAPLLGTAAGPLGQTALVEFSPENQEFIYVSLHFGCLSSLQDCADHQKHNKMMAAVYKSPSGQGWKGAC